MQGVTSQDSHPEELGAKHLSSLLDITGVRLRRRVQSMRLVAGTTPQPTMTPKLQLGEHIKTISGRKYIYSSSIRKRGGKTEQKYERPLHRKQQKTMEYLSAKDKGIIERAFERGVAVSTIQNHVWNAIATRVAASTIYAYMKRHGVPREKRDVRIDKGKKRK